MAVEKKKKSGLGAEIFSGISQGFAKGIGAGFVWILSVVSKIVAIGLGIWGIVAFAWDYITANFSLTIPIPLMGDVVVKPEPTHYFAGFLNFVLGLGLQLGALDEESFPIEEGGLDGLEALDDEPAPPPPPETLGTPPSRGKQLVFQLPGKKALKINLPKRGGLG